MIRTQIQLTEKQRRRLRALAHEKNMSLAEVIRRCIERSLERPESDRAALYERASHLVGAFPERKGAADLSARHDRYAAEAFE